MATAAEWPIGMRMRDGDGAEASVPALEVGCILASCCCCYRLQVPSSHHGVWKGVFNSHHYHFYLLALTIVYCTGFNSRWRLCTFGLHDWWKWVDLVRTSDGHPFP